MYDVKAFFPKQTFMFNGQLQPNKSKITAMRGK